MNCNSLSNEKEDEVELVRSLLSAKRQEYKNLVTPEHLLESGLLQESKLCFFGVYFLYIYFV